MKNGYLYGKGSGNSVSERDRKRANMLSHFLKTLISWND